MKVIIFCVSCALFSMAWTTFCDMPLWLKCVLYFVNGCTLFLSGMTFQTCRDFKFFNDFIDRINLMSHHKYFWGIEK